MKANMLSRVTVLALILPIYSASAQMGTPRVTTVPASESATNAAIAGITPASLSPLGTTTNTWGDLSFWTGAKFSNPYVINGNSLKSAGNTSDGYIEIELSTRYILRDGPAAQDWLLGSSPTDNRLPKGQVNFLKFWEYMPDIDSRIGYLFRGSSAPTNYSSSTIVGSADFYGDTSLGLPILR